MEFDRVIGISDRIRKRSIARYGSLTGFAKRHGFIWFGRVGGLRRFQQVEWNRVSRLVFACRGNICRSPYAQARAAALGVPAASFGISAEEGSPVDASAVRVARQRGLDLTAHRAVPASTFSFQAGDLILCMEPEHGATLAAQRIGGAQTTLLGLWHADGITSPYIHDPYGLDDAYFNTCFDLIDRAVGEVALRLQDQAQRAWRRERAVLVVEAQSIGSVAVIRSLGLAGYAVHAASNTPKALGFLSSQTFACALCPGYAESGFLPWLRAYVNAHDILAIIPSEGFLLAIEPVYEEIRHLLPCPQSRHVIYRGMSKVAVHELLASAPAPISHHLPASLVVERDGERPSIAQLERLGTPLFLKADALNGGALAQGTVWRSDRASEAHALIEHLLQKFARVLVQGWVPGHGAGVFFLLAKGRVLAEFMHRRLHEVPHTGGVSSYRESWHNAAIRDDALAKVAHLGWEGVAMLEYRAQPGDKFHFIEFNGRFWGSLHLALWAGIDFPALLLDTFFGRPPMPGRSYSDAVRCRYTFPYEVQHVWSRLKDRSVPLRGRFASVVEFFVLGANREIHSDLYFPGDRRLYLEGLKRFVRSVGRS